MPLVAGVDSSTQSTKIEVRDADTGALITAGRAPHPPTTPPVSEQDPSAWLDAFDEAWAAAGSPAVAAISIAAQQHGMVVVDPSDHVIRPAKLWNDTTSAPDAERLLEAFGGPAAWAARTGSVPVASFTVTKLAWLKRAEPDAYARMARVMLPHDWLTGQICGSFTTDRGDASGTGYWSPADGQYCFDVLALVDDDRDWAGALPRVAGPSDQVGSWNGAAVGCGTGDNMAAAAGLGVAPRDAVISLGTSGTAYTVATSPAADPSGSVAGFADATGRYLPLVATLNATKVTESVARWLGVSPGSLGDRARRSAPGANGVVVVPYFDGERTPNRPDATGSIAGLRTSTTDDDLARAAFEGVVCHLLDACDALGRASPVDGRLLLVGGGSKSPAYRQIVADLAGRPVVIPPGDEHVALGACVQAAAALHGAPLPEVRGAWTAVGDEVTVEPSPDIDSGAIRERYRSHAR